MAKQTPEKCKRCAPLTPADARVKHPDCWDDKLCTARRFYINNRDRINQKRARKRIETNHQVSTPDVKYGILHVWRENREDSPIHAIGVEIWEQNTKRMFGKYRQAPIEKKLPRIVRLDKNLSLNSH